jgi:hypothetical protein
MLDVAARTADIPSGAESATKLKICKHCGEKKALAEFHIRTESGRPRAECKACYRAEMNARRDPIDNRMRVKAWQQANPEKRNIQSRRHYEGRRNDLERWIAVGLRSKRAYCKKHDLPCTITPADVVSLFNQQNGLCALTGRELLFGSKGTQRDSLSIDRIESGRGYILGNIRLVTYQANMARGQFSDEELLAFCRAVIGKGPS